MVKTRFSYDGIDAEFRKLGYKENKIRRKTGDVHTVLHMYKMNVEYDNYKCPCGCELVGTRDNLVEHWLQLQWPNVGDDVR
jgi:hypothetical protein